MIQIGMRRSRYKYGDRVAATVGDLNRQGTIVQRFDPWDQYRVRWDDGSGSSMWWNQITTAVERSQASHGAEP